MSISLQYPLRSLAPVKWRIVAVCIETDPCWNWKGRSWGFGSDSVSTIFPHVTINGLILCSTSSCCYVLMNQVIHGIVPAKTARVVLRNGSHLYDKFKELYRTGKECPICCSNDFHNLTSSKLVQSVALHNSNLVTWWILYPGPLSNMKNSNENENPLSVAAYMAV